MDSSIATPECDEYLLDIERHLAGRDGPSIRESFLEMLERHHATLVTTARRGLAPDQYACSEALRLAIEAAYRVMKIVKPVPLAFAVLSSETSLSIQGDPKC